MKTTPAVIFKLKAFSVKDFSEEGKFYRCRTDKNNISYISEKFSKELSEKERIEFENMAEMGETFPSNIGYMANRKGSAGAFNKDKFLNQTEINKVKQRLKNTESFVWAGVVSFTPEMASSICYNRDCAKDLITNHLHKLFENTTFDYDNIDWIASYHTNTDNPHIHLTFYEKEPLNIASNGKKKYSSRFMLPKENMDSFKYAITQEKNSFVYSFTRLRDPIRQSLKTNVLNNKFHMKNLLTVGKPIIDEGLFQYNRLSPENKALIKNLVKYTLRNFPDTLQYYDDYKKQLIDTQASFISLAKENGVKPSKEAQKFYSSRITDLDTRLANTMLKILKNESLREEHKISTLNAKYHHKGNLSQDISKRFIKESNKLDIGVAELNRLLFAFNKTVQKDIYMQTEEDFKIKKRIRGEVAIYE